MTASPATVRAAAANLGSAAPPMIDGEPVFAEPWEGRAYGLALDLVERRGLPWDAFRDRLIAAITAEPDRPYYQSWVVALEALAAAEHLTNDDELAHERAEMGAYHYDENGVEIEVTPLSHRHGLLVDTFGSDVVAASASYVELYRTWSGGQPATTGVRTFDDDGSLIVDQPIEAGVWMEIRDRLLAFGE